jgi:streptogramin lyase
METYATDFPQDLVIAFDSVWTANESVDTVTRIDPTSGKVTAIQVQPGLGPQSIEAAGGAIWTAGAGGMDRVDPATNSVMSHVDDVGPGISFGFGSLWTSRGDVLVRIDPQNGHMVDVIKSSKDTTTERQGCGASPAAGSVWFVCGTTVDRVDPDSGEILATLLDAGSEARVQAAGGATWLLTGEIPFQVSSPELAWTSGDRLDPETNQVVPGTTVELVRGAAVGGTGLPDGDFIWFPTSFGVGRGAGMLYKFDARSGTVVKAFDLSEGKGYGSNAIAFGYGSLWTATGLANQVRRFAMPPGG